MHEECLPSFGCEECCRCGVLRYPKFEDSELGAMAELQKFTLPEGERFEVMITGFEFASRTPWSVYVQCLNKLLNFQRKHHVQVPEDVFIRRLLPRGTCRRESDEQAADAANRCHYDEGIRFSNPLFVPRLWYGLRGANGELICWTLVLKYRKQRFPIDKLSLRETKVLFNETHCSVMETLCLFVNFHFTYLL